MAKTNLSGADFICSVFKPSVLILTSTDSDLLCVKNHLTFTDLLKPFSVINRDVILRDQNNISHTIKNLRINFVDFNSGSLSQLEVKKLLNDVVCKSLNGHIASSQSYKQDGMEIMVPETTPWFEAWRHIFLENMNRLDHEFLNHYLTCIFVVSTFNNDVMDQFSRLSQQLNSFQNNNNTKFFNNSILKYYVLLHDQGQGDKNKADELYKHLKITYGQSNCFLLSINSASKLGGSIENSTVNSNNEPKPDPWLQFLVPGGYLFSDAELSEKINQNMKPEENSLNYFDDPLALFKSSDDNRINFMESFSSNVKNSTSYPLLNSSSNRYNFLTNDNHIYNSDSSEVKIRSDINKPHGQCLSPSDHDRIREFVYEFVSFALIPWVENTLKQLNDQIAYKMKMTRGIFNVTRKFFGGGSNSSSKAPGLNSNLSGSASNLSSNVSTKVVYTSDAILMQMRRHADLAFLFQQYEVAHQTYNALRKDFQDDGAWMHYAGVMEMSALSVFLQGSSSQRQYPIMFMDSAISLYISENRNMEYATRASLLNCEALKSLGHYIQSSNQFIKLATGSYTGDNKMGNGSFVKENELRNALLLEQSAHFYLHTKVPMLRKYAFHLILAGYRFAKAGQKHHTIRCYYQALPIFKGKNWTLAEDHIYATISKHAYAQKQLAMSLEAIIPLLTKTSRQSPSLQVNHLREYLKIYKELTDMAKDIKSLPLFSIPICDVNLIKVMIGQPTKQFDDLSIEAKDIEFSESETQFKDWSEEEKMIIEEVSVDANTSWKKIGLIRRPCLSRTTDNKKPSLCVVGEPITLQIFVENPLHIPLVLTEVFLLWDFKQNTNKDLSAENEGAGKISNENESLESIKHVQDYVMSELIHEICLLPKEKKPIEISIIPRYTGFVQIKGIAFYLNSNSLNQNLNTYINSYDSGNESDALDLPIIKLRGKIEFDKLFENDQRLSISVTPPMPKLKVMFSEFPKNVIIDEVSKVNITISNTGKESMKNISVLVHPSDYVTFGFSSVSNTISNDLFLENSLVNPKSFKVEFNQKLTDLKSKIYPITLDSIENELKPGTSVILPMWMRFNSEGDCKRISLKFLFYYEPVIPNDYFEFRMLRHKADIDLKPSISIEGQLIRCKGLNECSYLVNLKVENHNNSIDKGVTEFEIYQITAISKSWVLSEEFQDSNQILVIGPKETHSIYLKLKQFPGSSGDNMFSNIQYNSSTHQFVKSHCSPHLDFFHNNYLKFNQYRDGNNNQTDSPYGRDQINNVKTSLQDDISFIVLWKAVTRYSKEFQSYHLGQTHIFSYEQDCSINFTNNLPIKSTNCFCNSSLSGPTGKSISNTDAGLQPYLQYSKLISLCYRYQQNINNDFNKKKMLIIPVSVTIYNTSNENVMIRIEPLDPPEIMSKISRSNPESNIPMTTTVYNSGNTGISTIGNSSNSNNATTVSAKSICSNVVWIGVSSRQLFIKPHRSIQLNMRCIVTRPGVFEVQCLQVRAATIDKLPVTGDVELDPFAIDTDQMTFIKQENAFSSILTVNQIISSPSLMSSS